MHIIYIYIYYIEAAKRSLESGKLLPCTLSGSSSSKARTRKGTMMLCRPTGRDSVKKSAKLRIEDARDEHDAKPAVIHAVAEAIEAHVQGQRLAELLRHGAVGEPDRALVISIQL